MTVWLLEFGKGWAGMTPRGVYLDEQRGLKAYRKVVRRARKRHGIKIHRCTYDDGSHQSGWGPYRLRLRPVEV